MRRTVDCGRLKRSMLSQNKILGLSAELVDDLVAAYQRCRPGTFRLFKELIEVASIDRFGDYWHVTLTDAQQKSLYASLRKILLPSGESAESEVSADRHATLLRELSEYREAGQIHKAFLCLSDALDRVPSEGTTASNGERKEILLELGRLAHSLNRLNDALAYYNQLLSELESDHPQYLEVLYETTVLTSRLSDTDQMMTNAQLGQTLARSCGDTSFELRFARLKAWALAAIGNNQKAQEILDEIQKVAADSDHADILVLVHYTRGVMEWRRGDYTSAIEHLMEGLALAESDNLYSEAKPIVITLGMLHMEIAEYEKAVKFAKAAIQSATKPADKLRLPTVFTTLSIAYTRLGEYHKAEYWLQRYLNVRHLAYNRNHLLLYYHTHGLLKANSGEFREANDSLQHALELGSPQGSQRPLGKVHQNLAEVALFQGNKALCEQQAESARSIFERECDKASLAEIKSIEILFDICYGSADRYQELADLLITLTEHNCKYYAARCLLRILTAGYGENIIGALASASSLADLVKGSKAPLFRAVSVLAQRHGDTRDDASGWLQGLKTAYRILHGARCEFYALLISQEIAHIYIEQSKQKLARKFLSNSLRIAQSIENETFGRMIEKELDDIKTVGSNDTDLVESIHSISEIVAELGNYDNSLDRMIQFAVEQSGAERGALLLRKGNQPELHVVAFFNCDEESLSDILDISSKIPLKVSDELQPLVVENAVADARTRDYRSIVYHNILSVACIPVVKDHKFLGVLYLDHHTIPALFEREDITYITSIANFIALLLTTAKGYRSFDVVNRQLVQDLNALGLKNPFISRDSTVLEMFSKLPEIAQSDAPVLILGESGTGKEILAQMIHEMSHRHDRPLLKLNCSAIASGLIESELFGVAKNVATGVQEREGKFAAADGGTLLLDEIGDMPSEVQAKLLRAVEYQEFEKVGSNRLIYTDIRFLYSTNKDLVDAVKRSRFREDLFYRINTITIEIPPLRERLGDVELLIDHFLKLFSSGKLPPRINTDAIERLSSYDWPGNVRELKNFIERLCILYSGQVITKSALPIEIQAARLEGDGRKGAGASIEKVRIRRALMESRWNQSKAAKSLNTPLSTLRRKIKRYNIIREM
ncbi:MAG: sigma 54-interacting transcriptional regulator [candidate division Zixibacteria bacterium]|nr:sigma 54-interacting transcriptional regulator [candidate division Zixibacteria bacterium]